MDTEDIDLTVGVCTLCLTEGAVKNMLTTYMCNGKYELYFEMLFKCFCIDISTCELGDLKRVICEDCILKLRECLLFRHNVEKSIKTLENSIRIKNESELQQIKAESDNNTFDDLGFDKCSYDDDIDDDDEDDNIVLQDIVVKREALAKNGSKTTKIKKNTSSAKKIIKYSGKKLHDMKETETMLQSGLFPFRMHKNRNFSCAICPEKAMDLDDIKVHISSHNKKNIHIAFQKMILSKSQRFYKFSIKLRCKMCTMDVSNYEELKHHIDNCTRMKFKFKFSKLPFKLEKDQLDCPICKKTFLNFVSLNTHMNVHYPNYICENCGKAFASTARLRGHIRTHEIGEFQCRYCDAVFDRVTKRENHVSKEHKAGVRYACKRCNISLSSFYARQKHLAEVHNEELKRYKCKVCPQSYITPGHLSSHVRRDHLNERNHKCDKCDLAFYTKNALKMHMIKHDGERIHSCNICNKSYQRKKTLREHMRIHNNDKRFICPVCGRAFTQKCTLKGHLRVHDRQIDTDIGVVNSV